MTRGEKVIAFIHRHCRVPEGKHVGKPLRLAEFQRSFILEIYDNPKGTRRAYLSIARKNGKTGLIASILLAHLVGPEALQNSQIVSGAMSRDQAALVFQLAKKMVELNPTLADLTHIIPSSKRLIGKPMNVEFRALAAEGKTAHGLSPVLAILDEVGQIKGERSDFVDAIETSQGAHDRPLLIAISTQAPTDSDMLSRWLDDEDHPQTVKHIYAADEDAEIMDESQWRKANPALGDFRMIDDVREMAEKAHRMPSFEPTFRNLILNQRVETSSPFVSRSVWEENGAQPEPLKGRPVFGGLDLSQVQDLTALVLCSGDDGPIDVEPTFWLPKDALLDRAKLDKVPYDVWHKDGYLQTCAGKAIRYEDIARHLRGVFDLYDVRAIAFDRWGMRHLIPWLEKAGFGEDELERFVPFGQGFKDMTPALRELETALLDNQIRHGNHPVLKMCAGNAVTQSDPAGSRKLAKDKAKGRIDGMVALAMAIGVASEHRDDNKPSVYESRGIRVL